MLRRNGGKNDVQLGKSYLEKAKARGSVNGCIALMRFYSSRKMVDEFCAVMDERYKKFWV